MQTKILMMCSSAVMLALGLLTTFAPQELLAYSGTGPQTTSILVVQAAGALYLGFSVLNWMAKENLMGGIYSRPVAIGNFFHFFVMAATLVKALAAGHREAVLVILAITYVVFAVWFGLVVFKNPSPNRAA